jgi:serine/threonine-protein kinase
MDWDDDNEATHVYDKGKAQAQAKEEKKEEPKEDTSADASSEVLRGPEESEPERASMDVILSQPPRTSSQIPAAAPVQPPPLPPSPSPSQEPDPASLSGAFSSLGLKNGSAPPSSQVRSQPPASGSMRSVPPPPPTSQKGPSVTTQPMPPPPPPPPGQTTTAPMHMPVAQRQGSTPPTANTLQSAQTPIASAPPPAQASVPPAAQVSVPPAAQASAPPPYNAAIPSAPPVAQLPPVSRAMEQTLLTRKEPSKAPLFGMLLVAVMAIAGLAVFFLMPRPGTLVINVSDTKGAAVGNLEIFVDGTKRCETAPCIVRDISAGVHEVKVTAKGYEPPAPRAITVDKGRDVATDFQLVSAKTAAGTGFKVAAAHGTVKLFVDGKEVGVLPQEVRDLEPGEHKLRFVADRYVPLEKTISIGKDEIVDLGTVSLKVAKGKATIQLGTPGAKVYLVNGATRKEVPQLPMAIEFDPNETWELLATKDGFDDLKEQIRFDDGQADKTFTVTLSPKGTASRATIAAAAAPEAPAIAAAAAPAAPAPKAASAPVAAKEPSSDVPKEKAAAGGEAILKINSLPASSIILDGKPIGVTPQTHVPVSPGTHTIMFVNAEQSLKKTITVEVKAGETKAAFAKLRD